MKRNVAFLYIDNSYSIYHSLPVALQISDFDTIGVSIFCSPRNESTVKGLLKTVENTAVEVITIRPHWYIELPLILEIKLQKRSSLFTKYKKTFASYDAVFCSLYNDLELKKYLPKGSKTKLIFANHGLANRAYSFDCSITKFDLFFILDKNEYLKRKELGHLTNNNYVVTGFIKYDLIKKLPLITRFDDNKKVVVYNPHWDHKYSSFFSFGLMILDYFSNHEKYNLIFAPHTLLYERNIQLKRQIKKYENTSNIYLDYGTEANNDMSYARNSAIYIGDVSSQVYEYIYEKSKPCIFLDAHNLIADDSERPLSWSLGEVVSTEDQFKSILNELDSLQAKKYQIRQEAILKQMFGDRPKIPTPTDLAVKASLDQLST